jgi:hypothetical protein
MTSKYNIGSLDAIIASLSDGARLPTSILHRIIFCSLLRAGLSLYGPQRQHEEEFNKVLEAVPSPYKGLINGKLYLMALDFVKSFNRMLTNAGHAILLREASLHYILDFLKSRIGKVGSVMVLDCASIPEFITIASKFRSLRYHPLIFSEIFINPIGVTRFLTEQLKSFGQEDVLRGYAELLKQTLNANFYVKSSVIDLTVHKHGVSISEFLESIDVDQLFNRAKFFASQSSILITSDHGYDIIADEQGLYVAHGYKKPCPLNFSKMALFLVVD